MKRTLKIHFTAFLLFLFALPIVSISQESDSLASITGIVKVVQDSTNLIYPPPNFIKEYPRALPNAVVYLMLPDSTVITGDDANEKRARYHITNIKPGDYIIKAYYVGYTPKSFAIHLDQGETLTKNFYLGYIYPPEKLPFAGADAKEDISNGVVILKDASVRIWKIESEKKIRKVKKRYNQIQKSYGFIRRDVKDEFSELYKNNRSKLYQAVARYNHVVKNYLRKINGPNWWEKYQKDLRQACYKVLADSTN